MIVKDEGWWNESNFVGVWLVEYLWKTEWEA